MNPLLQELMKRYTQATTPLVPESAIKPAQDWLDTPTPDRSPWEARLRGFGAGALEGLRGQTSPANLAGLGASFIAPGAGTLMKGVEGAGGTVSGLSRALPMLSEADRLAALGGLPQDIAASGGEAGQALYNAARTGVKTITDPVKSGIERLLMQRGR